jgi:hypothetical protein
MVGGKSWWSQRVELLLLVISGFLAILFAWKLFRWEKEERISTRAKFTAFALALPFLGMGIWVNFHGNLKETWKSNYALMIPLPAEAEEGSTLTEAKISLYDFDPSDDEATLLKPRKVVSGSGASMSSLGELEIISPGASGSPHALQFRGRIESAAGS